MDQIISKKYKMTLDAKEKENYVDDALHCKRDDSILFYITIQEDGNIKDLTNCKFSIISIRNNTDIMEQVIDEPTIEDNVLVYAPTKEFTATTGILNTEITVYDMDENITIQNFIFYVNKKINTDEYVPTGETIYTLIEANKIVAKYKEDVKNLMKSIDDISETFDKFNYIMSTDVLHEHKNKENLDTISNDSIMFFDSEDDI